MYNNPYVVISPEVQLAIEQHLPIVALESTIISHGMPYPENVQMALQVEKIVRDEGAVPATIAIINGKYHIGLTVDQIEYFGHQGVSITKVSRRDLPTILAQGKDGACTVATTMIGAAMVGIEFFATGGIGGVHRGAETTMDISADLEELANTNVLVVCAGAKSILDLGLTLEYLETKGVPVIGFGTNELPAFYTRRSGFGVDAKVDSATEIAKIWHTKRICGLQGGMVVANPIPEAFSLDDEFIRSNIDLALKEAQEKGIKGKATTPFLLGKIKELTKGKSLEANLALVYNNAFLAATIAVEAKRYGTK
jgi:pseudouridylate synthase